MKAIKFMHVSFLFLVAIIWFSIGCKDDNPVGTNGSGTIIWQQTSLDSLRIISLASHPQTGVLASSCSSPIFRTFNNGTTWTPVFPNDCPRVLAINSKGEIFSVGGSGMRRSIDNANSWTETVINLNFGLDLNSIIFESKEFFVTSTKSDETHGGIYRSMDSGESWSITSFPDSLGGSFTLAINHQGYIFAGTVDGVFRSKDKGSTWDKINFGFRNIGFGPFVFDLAVNPINREILAAIYRDGVYRSADNGDSWIPTKLTDPFIETIVVNSEGNIFAGSGQRFGGDSGFQGVFYSIDNGNTWAAIDSGLTNLNILSLAVDDSGYVYAGTHGDGVFRTMESTTLEL